MLRWGRPKATEGGEVGARSAGKVEREKPVGGAKRSLCGAGEVAEPLLFININLLKNICDIKILMIIS